MALEIGPSPEMYLKTMDELSAGRELVSISAVAERMGVTTVSANEMVHRLEQQKLVRHQRYRGVSLTRTGRTHARALIRRHRLWECFLYSELGMAWEAVHDLACELEHAAPDEVTEALGRRMDHPPTCPHGNPIPDSRLDIPVLPTSTLAELNEGDRGSLISVHPETTETLSYLASHDFYPGTTFAVERIEPTDRLYMVRHAGGTITVGPELASLLHVRREAPTG